MAEEAEEVVLDLARIRAVRVLGRGALGTVFLVAVVPGPPPPPPLPPLFALKVFHKSSAAVKPHALRRARWELSLLSRLSSGSPATARLGDSRRDPEHHPFLPCLLGSIETPDLLAWALPFCPGGDLHALRRSLSHDEEEAAFSPAAVRFYLSEIVSALAHFHSLRIAYRDLKPENVLLQSSGHVMLADFDLSRHLPSRPLSPPRPPPPPLPSDRNRRRRRNLARVFSFGSAEEDLKKKASSARVSPVNRRRASSSSPAQTSGRAGDERSFSFVGTEEYVAPEVVRGDGHGFAVDWWSLGILAYEMAYGRTPFRGRDRKETFRNVLARPLEFPGRRRTDLTDLIERLLVKDPEGRLGFAGGAEEVKAHPFFKGLRWELLPEVSRPPFLAPAVEEEEELGGRRAVGFDVRDYLKGVHQRHPAVAPSASSESLAEF